MVRIYAFGSNNFNQCRDPKENATKNLIEPLQLSFDHVNDVGEENSLWELACTTPSQVIISRRQDDKTKRYEIFGFASGCMKLPLGVEFVKAFLHDYDSLAGYLGNDGVVYNTRAGSSSRGLYKNVEQIEMGVHGDLLAFVTPNDGRDGLLIWCKTLDDFMKKKYKIVSLPEEFEQLGWGIREIKGGAGHFVLYVVVANQSHRIYSFGDNRLGQLGNTEAPTASTTLASKSENVLWSVGMLDQNEKFTSISVGDLHTCVLSQDGALYMHGHDGKGQCGGMIESHGEVILCNQAFEDQDVLSVGCGSTHTVVVTSDGNVWSCGNICGLQINLANYVKE